MKTIRPSKTMWAVTDKLSSLQDQIIAYLDWFEGFDDISYAAVQGAAGFCPSMLPKLWQDHPCPYSTPIYKEAWYRGFYSAATWYLIDALAGMQQMSYKPSLESMLAFYAQEHPDSQWKRVPAGKSFMETAT